MDELKVVLQALRLGDNAVLREAATAFVRPPVGAPRLEPEAHRMVLEVLKQHCSPNQRGLLQESVLAMIARDSGGFAPAIAVIARAELFQLCTPSLLASVAPKEGSARSGGGGGGGGGWAGAVGEQGTEAEADAVLSAIAESLGDSRGGAGGRSLGLGSRSLAGASGVPLSSPLLLRSVHTGLFVAVAPGAEDEEPVLADLSRPPSASHGNEGAEAAVRRDLARSGLRAGQGSGASAFGLGLDGDGPSLLRTPKRGSAVGAGSAPSLASEALLPVAAAFRFAVVPAGATYTPAWALSRPFLAGSFVLAGPALLQGGSGRPGDALRRAGAPVRELGSYDVATQESLLAADVIDAMLGHTGRYVVSASSTRLRSSRARIGSLLSAADEGESSDAAGPSLAMAAATGEGLADVEFVLSRTRGADTALLGLARQLLPAATHAARARRFVELNGRADAGMAAQALADAAKALLHELGLLLTQIEADALAEPMAGFASRRGDDLADEGAVPGGGDGDQASSAPMPPLQRLWFHLQPALRTLAGLHAVVDAAGDARGGKLLDRVALLSARAGDAATASLCRFLLERAAAPFLRQVEAWVFRGELVDDGGLFMVQRAPGAGAGAGSGAGAGAGAGKAGTGRRLASASSAIDSEGAITDAVAAAQWWTSGFELSEEQCPAFLRPHAGLVLEAGRNLAALRRCAADTRVPADAAAAAADLAALASGSFEGDVVPGAKGAGQDPALSALRRSAPAAAALAAASRSATAATGSWEEADAEPTPFSSEATGGAAGPDGASVRLEFSTEARAFEVALRSAHASAAKALLRHLVDRSHLGQWLESMRRYFLLAQGDFVSHFMDSAEEELERLADPTAGLSLSLTAARDGRKIVSLQRLRSLVELSLRMSSASAAPATTDPGRDLLSCDLEDARLLEKLQDIQAAADAAAAAPHQPARRRKHREGTLRGYQAIALSVEVPWPVSLVISPDSLIKYRLLFRHLFLCKHVERKLSAAWTSLQGCKELRLRRELAQAHALRARMQHFVRNLVYYMTIEAMEPRWAEMQRDLAACETVDALSAAHERFLDTSLKECLLTSLEVFKPLDRLVALCGLFADRVVKEIAMHMLDEEEVAKVAGVGTPLAAKRRRDGSTGQGRAADIGAAAGRGLRFIAAHATEEEKADAKAIQRSKEQHRRRAARVAAQSESMRHSMGQEGWRSVIMRASEMFDKLLGQFMSSLVRISQREYRSRVVHLVTRLDFNGFYAETLAAEEAKRAASASRRRAE
ncbi:hypothetical protein FNF27_07414 [Cafeteria roenbergensis]|uniref:Spindle pole body component n=1 Tax=Cafeteria roenbergensis TaxID=33653 RepID=A0A5A8DNI1_CAFRO|nr:hypothetical protein FNF27_07414 [Cafeteria roenbergensis]